MVLGLVDGGTPSFFSSLFRFGLLSVCMCLELVVCSFGTYYVFGNVLS